MPGTKGPVPPPLDLGDDDDESTMVSPPPSFDEPGTHKSISLDEDDEDRTTIDKRPGPGQKANR